MSCERILLCQEPRERGHDDSVLQLERAHSPRLEQGVVQLLDPMLGGYLPWVCRQAAGTDMTDMHSTWKSDLERRSKVGKKTAGTVNRGMTAMA